MVTVQGNLTTRWNAQTWNTTIVAMHFITTQCLWDPYIYMYDNTRSHATLEQWRTRITQSRAQISILLGMPWTFCMEREKSWVQQQPTCKPLAQALHYLPQNRVWHLEAWWERLKLSSGFMLAICSVPKIKATFVYLHSVIGDIFLSHWHEPVGILTFAPWRSHASKNSQARSLYQGHLGAFAFCY